MKNSFMKYIAEMWKRIFDYKGRSGRKEYWIPFAFNAVLTAAMTVCLFLKEAFLRSAFAYAAIVIAVYLCISFIPFISLTVRRLHDAGKSGKWYLLSFVLGVGTAAVIIMCAAKEDIFDPYSNLAVGLYGPPDDFYEDFDPSDNMNVDVYGPPPIDEFDPSMNTQVAVYGPPEYFNLSEETAAEMTEEVTAVTEAETAVTYAPETEISETEASAETTAEEAAALSETDVTTISEAETASESETAESETVPEEIIYAETAAEDPEEVYDPEENVMEDVYGPPSYFGYSDDEEEIDLPEPPEDLLPFKPEDNAPICVYGPPEFFQ